MKNFLAPLLLLFLVPCKLSANTDSLRIALFYTQPLTSLALVPEGDYRLMLDSSKSIALASGEMLFFSTADGKVRVRTATTHIGSFSSVALLSNNSKGSFKVVPTIPKLFARWYDDNAILSCQNGKLLLVNHVELEKYIAGVVEAEAGNSAKPEFYKAQVLLARTYALGHTDKHAPEGFNLCDDVHCQAFKGRSTRNPEIFKAALATHRQVVADSTGMLIIAAFHSTCGGETANSEQVWPKAKSYLTRVTDPYCVGKRNATWEKRMLASDFTNYLSSKGFSSSSLGIDRLTFLQGNRNAYYKIGRDSIAFSRIRSDLGLRSAFFSVATFEGEVVLKGKGYGHGVGMCQIGAMEMANRGMDYTAIINFYFKGVKIISIEEVTNFFPDARELDLPICEPVPAESGAIVVGL